LQFVTVPVLELLCVPFNAQLPQELQRAAGPYWPNKIWDETQLKLDCAVFYVPSNTV